MAGLEHLDRDLLDQARAFTSASNLPLAQFCMQAGLKMKFMDVKREVEAAASESRLNTDFKPLHMWTSSQKQPKRCTLLHTVVWHAQC